jgi:hypothetical protein
LSFLSVFATFGYIITKQTSMKTLLISSLMIFASIASFGQEKALPAQEPEKYEAPQQTQRTEQTKQLASFQGQVNSASAINNSVYTKETPDKRETSHSPNDTASDRNPNGKTIAHSNPKTNTAKTAMYKCPKCQRTFTDPGNYPAGGQCPYDQTTLVRVK